MAMLQKVQVRIVPWLASNWETHSVNPAVNGYFFSSPEPKAPGELIGW